MEEQRTQQTVRENWRVSTLTGLCYPDEFFQEAKEFFTQARPGAWCMVAIDILNFRLVNKLQGRKAGALLLRHIAEQLEAARKASGGVTGYFEGDNFCIILPAAKDGVQRLWNELMTGVRQMGGAIGVTPIFGVSIIDNPELPPEDYYDRATLALSRARARKHIVCYKPEMESGIAEEMRTLTEALEAIDKGEIIFFAQPQCDIFTGKVVGAESLARWQHPTRGLVPPGRFIPAMEHAGVIHLLDKAIWERVCEWLRSWIDRGHEPVPISINISRIDIISLDVPAFLIGLLKKYNIPAKYIKAEITESAYAEDDEAINSTVDRLREAGMLVMMDDFGSGYSSLNMLKSVAVDVLKLDMRFLEISEGEEQKGIGILESIVNMARLMGLPIVVEGVETLSQENVLRNMGCRYVQGFYYYKPMPVEKFEEILADERHLDTTGMHTKQVEAFHVRELMDANLFTDTVLNNIFGPSAVYEVCDNQIEITRANEQYYSMAGLDVTDTEGLGKKLWSNVRDDDRPTLMGLFERAYERRPACAEGNIHYLRVDGRLLWLRVRVFFLREKEGRRIYFVCLTDLTPLRQHRHRQARSEPPMEDIAENERRQIIQYYDMLPCAFGLARILLDGEGKIYDYDIVYTNREMERMCGGDKGRLRHLILKAFGENPAELLDKAYRAAFLSEVVTHYARSSLSGHYLQMTLYCYERGYVGCLLRDVTHMRLQEGAFSSMVQAYLEVYHLHLQDNYCQMLYPDETALTERGNYEALVARHLGSRRVWPADEEKVGRFMARDHLIEALAAKNSIEIRYRRRSPDGSEEWCLTSVTISERENGKPKTAIITVRSIDHIIYEEERKRHAGMAEALANMSDAFFIYRAADDQFLFYANSTLMDTIYGYQSSREFIEAVGESFRGMVHPDDYPRVQYEIESQIAASDANMDYVQYRIIRKDGEIRWVDDVGHLEISRWGVHHRVFYVFIKDITNILTTKQKNVLIEASRQFNLKAAQKAQQKDAALPAPAPEDI